LPGNAKQQLIPVSTRCLTPKNKKRHCKGNKNTVNSTNNAFEKLNLPEAAGKWTENIFFKKAVQQYPTDSNYWEAVWNNGRGFEKRDE